MSQKARVFGEILFDRFQDGDYLGGTAVNFAWYLRQFGSRVEMASAVGRDRLGDLALEKLRTAGIEVSSVARRDRPTGTVEVTLIQGEPEYRIVDDVAWDFIPSPPSPPDPVDLFYFGTLSQRREINRRALSRYVRTPARHRIFDLNLRADSYSKEMLHEGFSHATIVKMNESEWQTVRSLFGWTTTQELSEESDIQFVALSRGGGGAELYSRGRNHRREAAHVQVVDTVGAGDAFSAALCASILAELEPERILEIACLAGEAVVQVRGAQTELDPDLFV